MVMTREIECPHCEKICAGPAGLASHVRNMHGDVGHPDPPRSNGHGPVELVWEDPPARGGKLTVEAKYGAVMLELRRAGGKWARLEMFEKKHAANAAGTKCKAVEEWADIEFAARTTADGGSALYARFKGEDDA